MALATNCENVIFLFFYFVYNSNKRTVIISLNIKYTYVNHDIHNVCVEYLCVLLNDVLGAWAHEHVEVEDATDRPVRERRSTREAVLWNTQ